MTSSGIVKKEIQSIQYLRGIAAMMVVFVHIPFQLYQLGYEGGWPEVLNSGVDIFFIISGFIIWVTTYEASPTPGQFMLRRLRRIIPLYWFLTTVSIAVMLGFPAVVRTRVLDLDYVIKSYLFIPTLNPISKVMEPVVVTGWTLNYEMFFYCLFALVLLLEKQIRMFAIIAVLTSLSILQVFFTEKDSIASYYTSTIILEFGFGILIGWLVTSEFVLPKIIASSLLCLGVAGLIASFFFALPRVIGYGIPSAVIVLGAVMFERAGTMGGFWFLQKLGDASYSIYLSHGIFLSALGKAWKKFAPISGNESYLLFTLFSVILVSLVSLLIYRFVEVPLTAGFPISQKLKTTEAGSLRVMPTSGRLSLINGSNFLLSSWRVWKCGRRSNRRL